MNTACSNVSAFDINCRRCPRLADYLAQVRVEHPVYYTRPVPPFGDPQARLLIVGLAPGKHGANASGRPFTGDHAGVLLYATLHAFGFATHAESRAADDDLRLIDCRITNAVKCLPPANKPTPLEVRNCQDFLRADLAQLPAGGVVVALGRIAHEAVLRALGLRLRDYPFAHAAAHRLGDSDVEMLDSYHCSRYNTQTRRLTPDMFEAVFSTARDLLAGKPA